jgi:hypothetical protein
MKHCDLTLFWDPEIDVIFMLSVTHINSRPCHLLFAGFLLGEFFDSEDGGDTSFRNVVGFNRSTLRYNPEDSTI